MHFNSFKFSGSGVVTYYLRESGVIPYLETLGFHIVGYGCMTCIGNSGPLDEAVSEAVKKGEVVACGVLSGKFFHLQDKQGSVVVLLGNSNGNKCK